MSGQSLPTNFSILPLYTILRINKKIKILNVGNFAVVGDIFYVA
jgi:hypothetical protein